MIFYNLAYTMVFTRAELNALSREELAEELIKCSNITNQLKILTDRFDYFSGKNDKLQSELVTSKKSSFLLLNRIINLERNTLSNAGDKCCLSLNKQC